MGRVTEQSILQYERKHSIFTQQIKEQEGPEISAEGQVITVFLLIQVIILHDSLKNPRRCVVIVEKILFEGQIPLQLQRGHLHFT